LSSTVALVGCRAGFALSGVSGRGVEGKVRAAALPAPETASVETPTEGNRVAWKLIPLMKSVSVSQAVVTGVPFVTSRRPPSASSVVFDSGAWRQPVSRKVSKYVVSSCEQAAALPAAANPARTTNSSVSSRNRIPDYRVPARTP
jgi:hypothetical protein